MNKPIDERDPMVDALRASLREHAGQAPSGDILAEDIIASIDTRAPVRELRKVPRRRWRTWTMPLVAAASVAAVVGGVLAIEHYQPDSGKPPAAETVLPPATTAPPVPTRSLHSSSGPSSGSVSTAPVDTSTLHGARVVDLTFAAADDGWALASADCIRTSGRCTALLRTTDGRTWQSMPGAAFNVPGVQGCAAPCVEHLRFATDQVGYAYGSSALFMTRDGGLSWQLQRGGAEFLETLDRNVIRVVSDGTGCPGPCNVRIETAGLGSTAWTTVALRPGGVAAASLSFSRGGADAYLLAMANPAGGANNATSTLYRSTDDGRAWQSRDEPCAQAGGEVDSRAVAAAPGGRVSVLCWSRQAPQRAFVATSSDHGASFSSRPGTIRSATADQLTGDPATVLVAAGSGLSRSTDGGRTWSPVPEVHGAVTFVGFESDRVARVVTDGGRTIWTTRDAGASWTEVTLR